MLKCAAGNVPSYGDEPSYGFVYGFMTQNVTQTRSVAQTVLSLSPCDSNYIITVPMVLKGKHHLQYQEVR